MEDEKIVMAYIAGLYDGDGSFTLGKRKPGKSGKSYLYYPLIQLCNRNRSALDFVRGIFGGYINRRAPYTKNGSMRQASFTLKLEKTTLCLPFLEQVSPFLFIKKERACYLLAFLRSNKRMHKLSDEMAASREFSYMKMKFLNEHRDEHYKISLSKARHNSNSELFWAYFAGLLDTDGSFSIKRETKKTPGSIAYSPMILLSMVHVEGIQNIRNNCEYGEIFPVKSSFARQGFCYRFGCYSKADSIELIRRVLPYLRIKKENARVLLDFCKNSKNTKFCRAGIPPEELQFREECYQKLCALNKYGVYKSSLMVSKLLPGNAGDNEGQAAQAGSLNVASEKTSKDDAVL